MPKRFFIDLNIKSNISTGKSSPTQIAKMASHLGFKAVALSDFNLKNLDIVDDVKQIFREHGIDLITRVDINEKTPRQLKQALRKLRRKVEVIAVFCKNLNVARLAARDRRVDLLCFSVKSWRKNFFDKSEAHLAIQGESILEVNLNPIIKAKTHGERIQAIRIYSENIRIAKRYNVPIIVTSGASSIYEMRAPRELAALATLLGLTDFEAREALSNAPLNLVRKNREKLSDLYIMPGVKIVKRGDLK